MGEESLYVDRVTGGDLHCSAVDGDPDADIVTGTQAGACRSVSVQLAAVGGVYGHSRCRKRRTLSDVGI